VSATPTPPQWPYPLIFELKAQLKGASQAELAERIQAQVDRADAAEATVVVVGETKTGKSSLVNALLGREGLVPVDADIVTNVHIVIHDGRRDELLVHFDDERSGTLRPGDLDLAPWASVAGNPDNEKGVSAVEVTLRNALLAHGIALVDTPGVGGLDTAHGRQTLSALADADALVFLADSGRPMVKPELDFLHVAAERIETVVFVYSKIDVQPGWRDILVENQALLARVAPRFAAAPAVAVSSALEQLAANWRLAGRTADADQLAAESGIAGLREFLVDAVAHRLTFTRRMAVLRLCLHGIAELETREHAVTRAGPGLLEDLEREESRLSELEKASSVWPQRVNDGFGRLRGRLQGELADLIRELGRRYGDSGIEPYSGKPDALRDALLREIHAIAAELSTGMRAGVERMEVELAEMLEPAGVAAGTAEVPDAGLEGVEVTLLGGPDRAKDGTRAKQIRLGYSAISQGMSFTSIGHLSFMAVLGVSATSFFGLGIGFGALLALAEGRSQRKQARLGELRPLVQEAIVVAQSKLSLQLGDTLLDIQRSLESVTRARIREEQAAATEARRRCQQQIQSPPEARTQAVAAAEQRLRVLAALRTRCEQRLGDLGQELVS
jgi:hypothetical protein